MRNANPLPPVSRAYIRSLHFDWCMFHLTFQFSEKSLHLQSIRQCSSMSQSDFTKIYCYFVEAMWQRAIDVNWTAHGTRRRNRFLFFRMISSPKNDSFSLSNGTWRTVDASDVPCMCVCVPSVHMSTWHAYRMYALQCAVNEWRVADNLNKKRWKLCETNETVADEWPKNLFVQTIRMARSSWTAKNKTNKNRWTDTTQTDMNYLRRVAEQKKVEQSIISIYEWPIFTRRNASMK